MHLIEPHIHMYSRTTDDYQRMFDAGIRAVVEPSFWLGSHRRYAGTFFDYFQLICEFEASRAERFGIDHYAAVAYNPKEASNTKLVDEVLAGIDEYIAHPRCVAIGEIGFDKLNDAEEVAFRAQLEIARDNDMPVIIHISHTDKLACIRRMIPIIRSVGHDERKIYLDHNTEETIGIALSETACLCGLTVYPISKLEPQQASAIIDEHGADRILVSGSADWGISDPVSLPKVLARMKADGHSDETLRKIGFENANAFYSQSPKWQPKFDLKPWPIEIRQP